MRLELKSLRAKKSLNEFRSFLIVVVASLVLQNHFEHFFRHCPSLPSLFLSTSFFFRATMKQSMTNPDF